MAALRVSLPGTGPPSLVLGPPSSLANQVFWPTHFLCSVHSAFVVKECINNLYIRVIIVYYSSTCVAGYAIHDIFISEDLF